MVTPAIKRQVSVDGIGMGLLQNSMYGYVLIIFGSIVGLEFVVRILILDFQYVFLFSWKLLIFLFLSEGLSSFYLFAVDSEELA